MTPRQRRKTRNPSSKTTRRTAKRHDRKRALPQSIPHILQAHWNVEETVHENYARLGLTRRLNGRTGGGRMASVVSTSSSSSSSPHDVQIIEAPQCDGFHVDMTSLLNGDNDEWSPELDGGLVAPPKEIRLSGGNAPVTMASTKTTTTSRNHHDDDDQDDEWITIEEGELERDAQGNITAVKIVEKRVKKSAAAAAVAAAAVVTATSETPTATTSTTTTDITVVQQEPDKPAAVPRHRQEAVEVIQGKDWESGGSGCAWLIVFSRCPWFSLPGSLYLVLPSIYPSIVPPPHPFEHSDGGARCTRATGGSARLRGGAGISASMLAPARHRLPSDGARPPAQRLANDAPPNPAKVQHVEAATVRSQGAPVDATGCPSVRQ